jgi:IclR family acetate operon transcriptional repressor
MSRTRQPSTRRIGAAERAIAVLDTLADGGELGTNEVARRTGMTPSTVSRQLGTLAASGLVERVEATGRYKLGIRIVHLANAVLARLDVREVARPHLVALVDATG